MRLSLWFHSAPTPELIKVEFQRRPGKTRVSVRRKAVSIEPLNGSFQWTNAVKALAILVVGTKCSDSFFLSGEGNSPAASLDYAISKPTSWIVDLFGREESGKPSAQTVFRRENSERKLPGPVKVTLASALKESSAVAVFLDNRELRSNDELASLRQQLERGTAPPPIAPIAWYTEQWFQGEFQAEIDTALRETTLLEPMTLDDLERTIPESAPDLAVLRTMVAPQNQRYGRPDTHSLAILQKLDKPLRIAMPPMAVGAYALIRSLSSMSIPVEIDAAFPSTTSIVEEVVQGSTPDFDCLVLSWGALQRRLSAPAGRSFSPGMLLPRTSIHLITQKQSDSITRVLLATDPLGYPRRYFESLKHQNIGFISDPEIREASFAEVIHGLTDRGHAAILSFPLSVVAARQRELVIKERNEPLSRIADNILCLHESLQPKVQQALLSLLRRSWFVLLERRERLIEVVREILEDSEYGEYLSRLGALYTAHR